MTTLTPDDLFEIIDSYYTDDDTPPVLKMDGLDDAVIGLATQANRKPLLIYSYEKIVGILVARDGMSVEEAEEFAAFNTLSAYVGEGTPYILVHEVTSE